MAFSLVFYVELMRNVECICMISVYFIWCVYCLGFVQDNFVIYTNKDNLFQVSLAQNSTWKLPLRQPIYARQISLENIEMKLYLTDNKGIFKRVNINGTDEKTISQACGSGRYLHYNV